MKNFRKKIVSIINRTLAVFGVHIRRTNSGFWDYDPQFRQLFNSVQDRTLVRIDRSYMLYQFARRASLLPDGDVAQVGIYKGGTARMVASTFTHTTKKIYLFDTFEGLPPRTDADGITRKELDSASEFSDVNFESVQEYFSTIPNTVFKKGYFPHTAKGMEDEKFCFVYLDVDLYQSIRDGLDFFFPRMTQGGVIMVDDYGTKLWPGVAKAVDEFCAEHNMLPVKTAPWQCLILK